MPATTSPLSLSFLHPPIHLSVPPVLMQVGRPLAGSSSKSPSSSSTSRHGPGQHHQQQQQAPPPPQRWRVLSSTPLAGGVLHVVQWEGPRNIRVWTPPGVNGAVNTSSSSDAHCADNAQAAGPAVDAGCLGGSSIMSGVKLLGGTSVYCIVCRSFSRHVMFE